MSDVPGCGARSAGDPAAIGVVGAIGSTALSGLAISHTIENLLWTHGDSGGMAKVYSLGATDASIHGTLSLDGATDVDWEDIATGPCSAGRCIFIADTGDNDLSRKTIAIYQVAEPQTAPIGTQTVSFSKFEMTYDDGPHDVASLFVDPRSGRTYVITKVSSPDAVVYELERATQVTTATRIATLSIPSADPRVTAADMIVDECAARILVRSHDALYQLRSAPTASVEELLAAPLERMPVAQEAQGEAVAWAVDGSAYFTVGEGDSPTLWRTAYDW